VETADFEHTLFPPPRDFNFCDNGITPHNTEIPGQPTARYEFKLGHVLKSKVQQRGHGLAPWQFSSRVAIALAGGLGDESKASPPADVVNRITE
jgi:hypothetical protein